MLSVDLYSDVVCPWCWIGKRRLQRVLAEYPHVDAVITWRPYQLQPDMPPDGVDWQQMIDTKFGGVARARLMFERVADVGRQEGITFAFERITRAVNTGDAHRALLWAQTQRSGAVWPLVEAMHAAYFEHGRDISRREILVEMAAAQELDADALAAVLTSDAFTADVIASQREAQQLGVTGVPFTVLDGRLGISGAQPDDVYRNAITQALAD